jgi:hypothetical protein
LRQKAKALQDGFDPRKWSFERALAGEELLLEPAM